MLLSSVLYPLALPNELFPLGQPVLGMIALAPLYLALTETDDPRRAAALQALFGIVSTLLANYWLMFFGDYSVWTIGGTTLGYAAYNYLLGGFLWFASRRRPEYRPVVFALVWTFYEYLKSIGFLAYPWGLAAYPFNMLVRVNQLAAVTGVWGITLIAVYLNAVLAELALGSSRDLLGEARRVHRVTTMPAVRHLAVLLLVGLAVLAYGEHSIRREIPVRDRIRLLLVQQNADSWNTRDLARPLRTAQELTWEGLAGAGAPVDVVVWSETSLRYFLEDGRSWFERQPQPETFIRFLERLPAPLLTGAPFPSPDDDFAVHNAVLLVNSRAEVVQWYGKQQLVPFAELVPFWDRPVIREFFQEVIGVPGIWAPGPGYRLFDLPTAGGGTVATGTPVCFEDAMAGVVRGFVLRGADLLVNLTNNSWSRTNSAQIQHFVAARYRAVETRRTLVRSTNGGYTTVIDPWGRVKASLPMFETAHLYADVPIHRPTSETVYTTFGDYLPWGIGLLLAVLFAVDFIRSAGQDRRRAALRRRT